MTTAAERNVASAEAYYQAMNDKNLSAVAKLVHPDVEFVGPMATLAGKEAFLEAASRFMSLVNNIRVRAKFGSDSQAILTYNADFGEPIGICRTAVLMTFGNALITRIELFYDARPFEKNLRKDAIFR